MKVASREGGATFIRPVVKGARGRLDGAPDRGHADLMDPLWFHAGAADQDVRIVIADGKLAHHADVVLMTHP